VRNGVTRRQALSGIGALAATGVGYSLVTQKADAKVELAELRVPNSKTVIADQSVTDVRISVEANWSWSGNADIHAWNLRLKAGSTQSNAEEIGNTGKSGLGIDSLTGTETLEASILNSSVYDKSDFEPREGSKTIGVVFILEFEILRNGEVVEKATATEAADVTVSKEELSYTVSLDSTGEITVVTG